MVTTRSGKTYSAPASRKKRKPKVKRPTASAVVKKILYNQLDKLYVDTIDEANEVTTSATTICLNLAQNLTDKYKLAGASFNNHSLDVRCTITADTAVASAVRVIIFRTFEQKQEAGYSALLGTNPVGVQALYALDMIHDNHVYMDKTFYLNNTADCQGFHKYFDLKNIKSTLKASTGAYIGTVEDFETNPIMILWVSNSTGATSPKLNLRARMLITDA